MKYIVLIILALLSFGGQIVAKEAQPNEDPRIEQRMKALTEQLRCLVCQNETLADSRADLAEDLRRQIREQMKAGKSDQEILAFLTQRYGDFVLYKPPVKSTTYLLGGYDGANIVPDVLSTTDGVTFKKVGSLPVPVRYPAVAVVGNAIYLFGGVSNSKTGVDTNTVQRLDATSGAIDTVATLPKSLSHASAIVLGGQVFLLGGYVDNTKLSDQILRFDPATGATTSVGALPAPVSDAAAVVIGKQGYLVGGQGTDRAPLASVTVISGP